MEERYVLQDAPAGEGRVASSPLIGPLTKSAADRLREERGGGVVRKLHNPPKARWLYVFVDAGDTPVRQWRERAEEIEDKIRELGLPIHPSEEWSGNDYRIIGEFEVSETEAQTATSLARETYEELRCLAGREIVETYDAGSGEDVA